MATWGESLKVSLWKSHSETITERNLVSFFICILFEILFSFGSESLIAPIFMRLFTPHLGVSALWIPLLTVRALQRLVTDNNRHFSSTFRHLRRPVSVSVVNFRRSAFLDLLTNFISACSSVFVCVRLCSPQRHLDYVVWRTKEFHVSLIELIELSVNVDI